MLSSLSIVNNKLMRLRDYQADAKYKVIEAWNQGYQNILLIEPTGAGKTVIFSDILREFNTPRVAIAHRQELVGQISLALARDGVRHKIIGPKKVIRMINNLHMVELGESYYYANSPCAVAGVDTLIRRKDDPIIRRWANSVTHWVQDEGHHVLNENKWGLAAEMFPNACGLGVSAAACRADGKGLGRQYEGLYDYLIVGPSGRELINRGFLTDYRIFAPPSDIDYSDVNISKSTGDFNKTKLINATRRSHIVGDVVESYLQFAAGKMGVTFTTDIQTAHAMAEEYNGKGVRAKAVSSKTSDADRIAIVRDFRNGGYDQLVNVDLFGEGFDLPAIECVSMTRKTMSYQLYSQQFGRALRVMVDENLLQQWDRFTNKQRLQFIAESKKPHAIIIDHVGNVVEHKLPDTPRFWSLATRTKRGVSSDSTPVTTCLNPECMAVYERIYSTCPYCGTVREPTSRSDPIYVDGDLIELDHYALQALRNEVAKVDLPASEYRVQLAAKHVPLIGQVGHVNKHVARQEAQAELRKSIALWAGYQRSLNRPDSESYRRFYFKFGVDVLSAQALGTNDAKELMVKIDNELIGIVAAEV